MLIHGGAWVAGDKRDVWLHAREMAEAGLVAVCINYRLAPAARMVDQLEDCAAAVRWVVEQCDAWTGDRDRIALWGYSAGAQLAAMLALDPPRGMPRFRAVVVGGIPSDFAFIPADSRALVPVMGGTRRQIPEVYRRFSPLEHVHPEAPPFFIFYGDSDWLVPPECGQRFAAALKKQDAIVHEHRIPGKGHFLAFLDPQTRRRAIRFLSDHLEETP